MKTPDVSVRVPLKVKSEFRTTPLVLLIVNEFNAVTPDGIVICVPEPPKDKLEVD